MNKNFKEILKWFLTWRLGLLLLALVAIKLVPARIDYLGGGVERYFQAPLLWGWANFDGVRYLGIAQRGYLQFQQAFFPFYPLLIRFLAHFFKNYLFAGLLISHLSFLISLWLFYRLVRLDFKSATARQAVIYLLLFPTAFYFVSLYTESLFLAAVLASFYCARKQKWLWAGIFGALASATRFVGIFLFPALLVEWWQSQQDEKNSSPAKLLPLLAILAGLGVYMWYLQRSVSDPLFFIHVQPQFGAGRTGGRIILLHQVFWRYFKMILTTSFDVLYLAVWQELAAGLLFLLLLIRVYYRLRLSYFVFMLLAFLAPTLTGTFSSLPRYVLVLFPGFMILALELDQRSRLKKIYLFLSVLLLLINTILFIRGYWVA